MCGLVHVRRAHMLLLLGKLTPISGSTRARASSSDVRVRRTTVSSLHRFVRDCRRRRRRPALPLLARRPSRAPCRTIKRKCTEFHFQYSTCIALALINPHLISSHLIAVRCVQICTRTHTRSARDDDVWLFGIRSQKRARLCMCATRAYLYFRVCASVRVCLFVLCKYPGTFDGV